MLRKVAMAGALAGGLLTAFVGTAEARPAMKADIATADGVILVAKRGGGGFARRGGGGGGFVMKGPGRGFALRGGGGGPRALRGGGPRIAGFAQRGPKFYRGSNPSRFADRGGRGFKGDGWKGRKFAGKHHRFHKHRKFNRFAFYAGPTYYAYYDSGYGCGWLYRRAVRTGSPYWWRRYNACRDGYYYD